MYPILLLFAFHAPLLSAGQSWSCPFEDSTRITAIVVTEDDHVFVLSQQDHKVFHLDPKGNLISSFGEKGEGPGEFGAVFRMQYLQETQELILTDGFKTSFLVFDREGNYKRSISLTHAQLRGILYAGDRTIFYNDTLKRPKPKMGMTIHAQDLGKTKHSSQYWQKLAHFSSDDHADAIPAPNRPGFFLRFPWTPRLQHASSPDGKSFYVTSNVQLNARIIDAVSGKVMGHIKDDLPRTKLVKAEIEDYLHRRNRRTTGSYSVEQFDNPEFKPAIQSIAVDRQGQLWTRLHTGWEAKTTIYRVFHPQQGYQGQLKLPPKSKVYNATVHHIWYTTHDQEEDFWTVHKQAYELEKR